MAYRVGINISVESCGTFTRVISREAAAGGRE